MLLYALANAGGVVAYLPLLSLLLPLKIEGIAPGERIGLLTVTALAGAVAASVANIVFGVLSDRSVARGYTRRRWVAGGLVATADSVPDANKGVAGGMLALANPLASLASSLLVACALPEGARYAVVCGAFAALIVPVLLVGAPVVVPVPVPRPVVARADMAAAWVARLLVQIAGVVLFGYLLFYFESIVAVPASDLAPRVGQVLALAFAVPVPVALIVGRVSDRVGARKPFLLGAAVTAAAGLAGMAVAPGWSAAVAAFFVYACGSAVFLGLHSALTMQMLPSPQHRGRDLGLLNLTNTLPSLIGPTLTWALATREDFGRVLVVLAVLTLSGGLVTCAIRGQK